MRYIKRQPKNIYQIARIDAGFSQEHASELLSLSVRSIADCEAGIRPVPDEVVSNMMKLYQAPWLGYKHMRLSPVGEMLLPEINCSLGIAATAVTLELRSRDLLKSVLAFMELAEDDTIDELELARFQSLQESFKKVVGALMAVVIAGHKKKNGRR